MEKKDRIFILQQYSSNAHFYYGIKKHYNPSDAWDVMKGYWGSDSKIPAQRLIILNDESFPLIILFKALIEGCLIIRGFNNTDFTGFFKMHSVKYLLNFNFFYFSKKTGCYYTSIMDMEFDDEYDEEEEYETWKVYAYKGEYLFGEFSKLHDIEEICNTAFSILKDLEKKLGRHLNPVDVEDYITENYPYASNVINYFKS